MLEKISALLDGELKHSERDQALTQVCKDEELAKAWYRYHLIRAAFRNEPAIHHPALVDRIASVIQGERIEDHWEDHRGLDKGIAYSSVRWRPTLAIAASLVLATGIAIFSLKLVPLPVGDVAQSQVAERGTKWDTAHPDHEDALNAFLVEHGEFTPASGMNGLMAYAKFVSYDASE